MQAHRLAVEDEAVVHAVVAFPGAKACEAQADRCQPLRPHPEPWMIVPRLYRFGAVEDGTCRC